MDPKNRQAVLELYDTEDEGEEETLAIMFQQANVVCRVTNSTRKIKIEEFSEFVKKTYHHFLTAFPFAKIKQSIHWTFAHVAELISLNDNFGLGEISENSLECTQHKVRHISINLARNTSIQDNFTDTIGKIWIGSDPKIRQEKIRRKLTNVLCSEDQILINSFFEEEND